MRILNVIDTANPVAGGTIEAVTRISAALERRGHHVVIATLDAPTSKHLSVLPVEAHGFGPGTGRYRYAPQLSSWLTANADDFDAALVHGLWNYASYGAWRGLKETSLPYAIYAHGMMSHWFNRTQPIKRWAKQAYWSLAQGRVMADAKAVLFTTDQERIEARTAFAGHAYNEAVLPIWADAPPANSLAQIATFRKMVPRLGTRPFILFLGRIHPKKGCDMLLEAFAKLAQKYPEVDLVMAGPNVVNWTRHLHYRAARLGIGDRLHWPGHLDAEEKWGAMRSALALILPSHCENFGLVVPEAMACSTPVLISDAVQIHEAVAASGGGLVAPDTVKGTEDLLERYLVLDQTQRTTMGLAARAAYQRQFSETACAGAVEKFLAQLARRY